jgi:hypothetical protein
MPRAKIPDTYNLTVTHNLSPVPFLADCFKNQGVVLFIALNDIQGPLEIICIIFCHNVFGGITDIPFYYENIS